MKIYSYTRMVFIESYIQSPEDILNCGINMFHKVRFSVSSENLIQKQCLFIYHIPSNLVLDCSLKTLLIYSVFPMSTE